jgi:hypothetical protein
MFVGLLHVDLDKCTGQLLFFPRRGCFAGAQPHDHVFPPRRLTGVERNILNDAIALVEDADDRDALRHRRNAALSMSSRRNLPNTRHGRVPLLSALVARGKCEQGQERCGIAFHAYSGIQGS